MHFSLRCYQVTIRYCCFLKIMAFKCEGKQTPFPNTTMLRWEAPRQHPCLNMFEAYYAINTNIAKQGKDYLNRLKMKDNTR